MTELKPCPFCGGKAKAFKWGASWEVEIVCQNKECRVSQSGFAYKRSNESEEETYERAYKIAKEKWNRRDEK